MVSRVYRVCDVWSVECAREHSPVWCVVCENEKTENEKRGGRCTAHAHAAWFHFQFCSERSRVSGLAVSVTVCVESVCDLCAVCGAQCASPTRVARYDLRERRCKIAISRARERDV